MAGGDRFVQHTEALAQGMGGTQEPLPGLRQWEGSADIPGNAVGNEFLFAYHRGGPELFCILLFTS